MVGLGETGKCFTKERIMSESVIVDVQDSGLYSVDLGDQGKLTGLTAEQAQEIGAALLDASYLDRPKVNCGEQGVEIMLPEESVVVEQAIPGIREKAQVVRMSCACAEYMAKVILDQVRRKLGYDGCSPDTRLVVTNVAGAEPGAVIGYLYRDNVAAISVSPKCLSDMYRELDKVFMKVTHELSFLRMWDAETLEFGDANGNRVRLSKGTAADLAANIQEALEVDPLGVRPATPLITQEMREMREALDEAGLGLHPPHVALSPDEEGVYVDLDGSRGNSVMHIGRDTAEKLLSSLRLALGKPVTNEIVVSSNSSTVNVRVDDRFAVMGLRDAEEFAGKLRQAIGHLSRQLDLFYGSPDRWRLWIARNEDGEIGVIVNNEFGAWYRGDHKKIEIHVYKGLNISNPKKQWLSRHPELIGKFSEYDTSGLSLLEWVKSKGTQKDPSEGDPDGNVRERKTVES
jgi:hypothetical protein